MTTSNDFPTCLTATGRCCKKVYTCSKVFIGETWRSMWDRIKEHDRDMVCSYSDLCSFWAC